MASVISKCKSEVTAKILKSPAAFVSYLNLGLPILSPYFEKQHFEAKSQFLETPELKNLWESVYTYFLKADQLQPDALIEKMFSLDLDSSTIDKVIADRHFSNDVLLSTFVNLLKKDLRPLDLWERIKPILKPQVSGAAELTLTSEMAKTIQEHVITPFSSTTDFHNWPVVMQLVQKKVTKENIKGVYSLAKNLGASYLQLIYDKGFTLIDEHDFKDFIETVHKNLPDISVEELIRESHKREHVTTALYAVLSTYGVKKRTFDKYCKDDVIKISVDRLAHLSEKLYGKEKENFFTKLKNSFSLPTLILMMVVTLLVICGALFFSFKYMKSHKTTDPAAKPDSVVTFQTVSPSDTTNNTIEFSEKSEGDEPQS